MPTLQDKDYCKTLQARLDHLRPDATPAWGKLSPTRMLAHVNDGMRLAAGELEVRFRWTPIALPGLKWFILNVIPLPEGAPTAPELLRDVGDDPTVFAAEVETLRSLINEFASRPPGKSNLKHPLFGRLSRKAWDSLGAKHIDHHFRQFGV